MPTGTEVLDEPEMLGAGAGKERSAELRGEKVGSHVLAKELVTGTARAEVKGSRRGLRRGKGSKERQGGSRGRGIAREGGHRDERRKRGRGEMRRKNNGEGEDVGTVRRRNKHGGTIAAEKLSRENRAEHGRKALMKRQEGVGETIAPQRQEIRENLPHGVESQRVGKDDEGKAEILLTQGLLEHAVPGTGLSVAAVKDNEDGGRLEGDRRGEEGEAKGANKGKDELAKDLLRRMKGEVRQSEGVAAGNLVAAQVDHKTLHAAQLTQGVADGLHVGIQSSTRFLLRARGLDAEGKEPQASKGHHAQVEGLPPRLELGMRPLVSEAQHTHQSERRVKVGTISGSAGNGEPGGRRNTVRERRAGRGDGEKVGGSGRKIDTTFGRERRAGVAGVAKGKATGGVDTPPHREPEGPARAAAETLAQESRVERPEQGEVGEELRVPESERRQSSDTNEAVGVGGGEPGGAHKQDAQGRLAIRPRNDDAAHVQKAQRGGDGSGGPLVAENHAKLGVGEGEPTRAIEYRRGERLGRNGTERDRRKGGSACHAKVVLVRTGIARLLGKDKLATARTGEVVTAMGDGVSAQVEKTEVRGRRERTQVAAGEWTEKRLHGEAALAK